MPAADDAANDGEVKATSLIVAALIFGGVAGFYIGQNSGERRSRSELSALFQRAEAQHTERLRQVQLLTWTDERDKARSMLALAELRIAALTGPEGDRKKLDEAFLAKLRDSGRAPPAK